MSRPNILPLLAILLAGCSSDDENAQKNEQAMVTIRVARPADPNCKTTAHAVQVDAEKDFSIIEVVQGDVRCPEHGALLYRHAANLSCGDFRVVGVGKQLFGSGDAELPGREQGPVAELAFDFGSQNRFLKYLDAMESKYACNVGFLIPDVISTEYFDASEIEIQRPDGNWHTLLAEIPTLKSFKLITGRGIFVNPKCMPDAGTVTVFFTFADAALAKNPDCQKLP